MSITKEEQKHYHIKHMKSDYRKKINNFPIIIRKLKSIYGNICLNIHCK
jgi:hypothetical protein